ncbi:MAG TPA: extracellular solute-binding protein [bacterium]|nr:extracellular solute-binding protein [bacterium]
MRKLPRRTFLRVAGLTAAGAATLGHRPVTSAWAQAPTELRIMWWGSKDRHDRTIKVLQMYQDQHPGIKFTYEFATFNDYWTRLATMAAGSNLPDIIQQDYARLVEWDTNHLMLPLDDFVKDGTINLTRVPKASIDGGRVNGKLYAINLGNNSQAVMLDVDAFKKAGIALPNEKWTWQDFEQICLDFHKKLGIWGMGWGFNDPQIWKSLYIGYGTWVYTPNGQAIAAIDDSKFVDLLKMLLRLQAAGAVPTRQQEISDFNNSGFGSASIETQPIVTGKAAMAYLWSNQVVAVASAAGSGRTFKLTHLPRPKGGHASNYLKPSQFFSITSNSKHPKESAQFIDFFTNSIEANRILRAERGIPIVPKVQEALKPLLSPAELETFRYIARVTADGSPLPPPDPTKEGAFENTVYGPLVLDPVLFGKISPEQGAKTLRAEGDKVLAGQRA